jgi:hypothetical protein
VGSWGTGLYDNDLASDLRDDFRVVVRAPWNAERLAEWVVAEYPAASDPADDDHTDIKLVAADLFWQFGLQHEPTRQAALAIVRDSSDLVARRELGMDEGDLRKREKVLAKLGERLSTPNPTPRLRRVLTKPERFVLDSGDVMAFPTTQGVTRNPYVGPREEARYYTTYPWKPDGVAVALVLSRHLKFDVFARYIAAELRWEKARVPTLDEVGGLSVRYFSKLRSDLTQWDFFPNVKVVTASALHLKRMELQWIGRLALDPEKVNREFSPRTLRTWGEATLASLLRTGTGPTPAPLKKIERRAARIQHPIKQYFAR